MMLTDFLRYPGVFKKSVRGEMCLFCLYLKLCPREIFLKMLPEGAILGSKKLPNWVIFKNFKSDIRLPVTIATSLSPSIFPPNDTTTS